MSKGKVVTTLGKIVEKFKENGKELDLEDIETIPLTCGNCGFKGILIQFVKFVGEAILLGWGGLKATELKVSYRGREMIAKSFFVCPKCGSGFIYIDERELSRIGLSLL